MINVLIIEDNHQLVKDIAFCLELRYPDSLINSVTEGLKGLEMLESGSFDLIMAGTSLPDIDTLDLIIKVRELSGAPLMILSEEGSDIERAKGLWGLE